MKKGLIAVIIVVVFLFMVGSFFIGKYNTMKTMQTDVTKSWADVETQLTRRYELIPNLVETVKGYAKYEKEVLTEVTEMRSRVGGAQTVSDKIEANNQLSSSLSRLMVVVEKYPDLKANQNFLNLQDELAGTENRIAVSRTRYNEIVSSFNKFLVVFPNNFIASMYNIKEAVFFKAPEGAQTAPKVAF